jgi:hypothetical protein
MQTLKPLNPTTLIPSRRWGPRPLDLDIIFYAGPAAGRLGGAGAAPLEVPHPRCRPAGEGGMGGGAGRCAWSMVGAAVAPLFFPPHARHTSQQTLVCARVPGGASAALSRRRWRTSGSSATTRAGWRRPLQAPAGGAWCCRRRVRSYSSPPPLAPTVKPKSKGLPSLLATLATCRLPLPHGGVYSRCWWAGLGAGAGEMPPFPRSPLHHLSGCMLAHRAECGVPCPTRLGIPQPASPHRVHAHPAAREEACRTHPHTHTGRAIHAFRTVRTARTAHTARPSTTSHMARCGTPPSCGRTVRTVRTVHTTPHHPPRHAWLVRRR